MMVKPYPPGEFERYQRRQRWMRLLKLTGGLLAATWIIVSGIASSFVLRHLLNPVGAGFVKVGSGSCSMVEVRDTRCVYCENSGYPSITCDWRDQGIARR